MPRWEPQARDRLRDAALELFLAHGFDNVTVAQITERAGLTRRTFSRYFTDKRDVLFDGSEQLPAVLAAAVGRAARTSQPFHGPADRTRPRSAIVVRSDGMMMAMVFAGGPGSVAGGGAAVIRGRWAASGTDGTARVAPHGRRRCRACAPSFVLPALAM